MLGAVGPPSVQEYKKVVQVTLTPGYGSHHKTGGFTLLSND